MKIRNVLILLTMLLLGNPAIAQFDSQLVALSWDTGIPTGDLKSLLRNEEVSLAGISIDARAFANDNYSVGLLFAWGFFNGFSDKNLNLESTDITGPQLYYLNYLPFMLNSHYYFGDADKLRTYVGGGFGAVRSLQRIAIGTFIIQNNNWHVGLYPEIGVIIPFSDLTAFSLAAKYHYAFETSDSIDYSYFSINLGIVGLFNDK